MKDAQAGKATFAIGVPGVHAAVDVRDIPSDALIVWNLWRGDDELLSTFERMPVSQGTITRTLLVNAREALPGKYRLVVKAGKAQLEGRFTIGTEKAIPGASLIEENFNDNALHWSLDNSQGGWARIKDGQLLLQIARANASAGAMLSANLADFDLSAAISQTNGWRDGYYTIYFRDTGQAVYALSVWTDGEFVVGYAPYGGDWINIVPIQRTSALKPGATNRLRVVAQGDQFAFHVNDMLIATVKDDRLTEGAIGLYAGTYENPDLSAVFDDLVVGLPKEAVVLAPTKVSPTAGPKPTTAPKSLPLANLIVRARVAAENIGGALDRLYQGSGAEACAPFLADYNIIAGSPTLDVSAQPLSVQGAYGPYRQAIELLTARLRPIANVCNSGGGSIGKLDFDLGRTTINQAASLLTEALNTLGQ